MKPIELVLLCLLVLLAGCGSKNAGQPADWQEVQRWQGETGYTMTPVFKVDAARWRLTWDTRTPAGATKRFKLWLTDATTHSVLDKVVETEGPDQGAKEIQQTGSFYLQIDARQPYTITLEMPK